MNKELSGEHKNRINVLGKGRFSFPKPVMNMHQIEDNYLLIYDWDALSETTVPKVWENVEYFDKDGNYLWTVNGMEECKYYMNNEYKCVFSWLGYNEDVGLWLLFTYEGYDYTIDFATGRVTYYRMRRW